MCQSPGMSGNKQPGSLSQRVGELGERQSQLNRDSRKLAERLSEQMRLQAGDREHLERIADEQARIREQLEQIQREDEIRRELLGRLDGAKREMEEVEEVLRDGGSDPDLEQKQQRILSRLLDAQRSLNRRDFNPERESRAGEDVARASAPELPPDLLRESDRLRHDLLKAESDRYPAQYRSFIEAYLRALNRSRR
jgi:DNA repair exonuclease SbcCD ATPase subunit